ncbi:MAG: ABC transporter ATP-binding protein [Gemmatimonadota bacterium]|nr:MAG: ABC transporter ATP-binding protein [Gemmatimonadota bacterium]
MTDQSTASGVTLHGIEKWFGSVAAVRSLDLEILSGELVVLLGPSGCGKTTVLRMIAGLEDPSQGDILIGDTRVNDIEPAQRDVAMVFQNYALYPHMTVQQNLGFGLKMRKVPRAELDAKVSNAAQVLELTELLARRPGQLSGGQRQRVALGRALVREPSVFLFDEPLSNLDARLRLEMRGEIAQLHRRLGTTMVYVTHDQVEAMTLGHRVAIMNEGVLQQYAPPLEVYQKPANLFVATFIGSPPINTVSGAVKSVGGRSVFEAPGLELELATPLASEPATLALRAEGLSLLENVHEVDFTADVVRLEPLGNEVLVYLDGPASESWVARVNPDHPCAVGDTIGVRLDRSRIHLFAGPNQKRIQTRLDAEDSLE